MLIKIEFTKPTGASVEAVAEFVIDALSSWGGQFHPEDPLFHSLRGKMKYVTERKDFRPGGLRRKA